MYICKIESPELVEAIKKYPELRHYTQFFMREGNYFFSKVTIENGKVTGVDLKDALLDWAFNEQREAEKVFAEYPKGIEWKVIKAVKL